MTERKSVMRKLIEICEWFAGCFTIWSLILFVLFYAGAYVTGPMYRDAFLNEAVYHLLCGVFCSGWWIVCLAGLRLTDGEN